MSNSLRPVDCSPPSSSIHGILQARILEWVAISFSRGSSRPQDLTQVSHIAGRRFNLCATKKVQNAVLGCNLKNNRMISVRFQGKPFNIKVIQVYAPTSNAEEAEVEQFYEDLQDLLELTPPKDVLFIIGDWNAKVGSQETPGVTGKFGLEIQMKQDKG